MIELIGQAVRCNGILTLLLSYVHFQYSHIINDDLMIRQRNSLVGSLFARSRAMPVLLIHWIIVKYFTQGVKELWRIGWMLQLMVLWFLRRRSGVKCILVFTTLILDLFIPFSANHLLYCSEIHATADCMKSWLHRRSILIFKPFD